MCPRTLVALLVLTVLLVGVTVAVLVQVRAGGALIALIVGLVIACAVAWLYRDMRNDEERPD